MTAVAVAEHCAKSGPDSALETPVDTVLHENGGDAVGQLDSIASSTAVPVQARTRRYCTPANRVQKTGSPPSVGVVAVVVSVVVPVVVTVVKQL